VRIRLLTLDYELRPLNKVHNLIFVSDPSGSRVAQWSDVDNKNGLLKICFLNTIFFAVFPLHWHLDKVPVPAQGRH
jgi:hypothetical protein